MSDIFTQRCSYCGKGLMGCECENFHPNIGFDNVEPEEPMVFDEPTFTQESFEVSEARIRFGDASWAKPTHFMFDMVELRAIYRVMEKQYISYEDIEAHAVLTRIMKIVDEQ